MYRQNAHIMSYKIINDHHKGVLAIRRIFSLVDIITHQIFNCPNVFKIGGVQQEFMHSKHQNTFQSDSSFTKP